MPGFDFSKKDNFYVYLHIHPKTLEVCYVGKGRNKRAYKLTDRISRHKNWLDKLKKNNLKPIIKIISDNLTDEAALKLEESLINEYRKANAPLVNIRSKGGAYVPKKNKIGWNKGMYGHLSMHFGRKRSEETKRNQSEAQIRKTIDRRGGAYFFKPMSKWHSRITIYGKRIHLGYFDTREEAINAYLNKSKTLKLWEVSQATIKL